ncbi:hypothetical protein NEIMUCOT_03526 [Neisseria mucosa ATCC 25996]|uniref:Uncharacterized protein n=1 Tax=Neisseria mucosa (strain ATCC 25996 / DSM 4631 / NCTC 10774 / M26) TaxID=546266 RepID=D2ZSE4_NEIM2|nr:hypothetical protein NEIMUCOT_03526 [Neisseria mucosa ATCC 25996]
MDTPALLSHTPPYKLRQQACQREGWMTQDDSKMFFLHIIHSNTVRHLSDWQRRGLLQINSLGILSLIGISVFRLRQKVVICP